MLDRGRLAQAIDKLHTLDQNNSQKIFPWSGFAEDASLDIRHFHIPGIGVIHPPLKPLEIAKITETYPPEECSSQQKATRRRFCQVDGSQLTFLAETTRAKAGIMKKPQHMLQGVAYTTLERMLNISFENLSFDVDVKLEKFIICSNEESYQAGFNLLSSPGKFGTLLLKIPLETKKKCGVVVVNDGLRETRFDLGNNDCYSVTAILGRCSNARRAGFAIASGPGEVTAVMVFHLVWKNYAMFGRNDLLSLACCFPELLISTNEMKTALTAWKITEGQVSMAEQHNDGTEETSFLSLPLSQSNKEEFQFSSTKNMLVIKCLMSINFLDVCCAPIGQERMEVSRSLNSTTSLSIGFNQAAVSSSPRDNFERSAVAEVVIRPRNLKYVLHNGTLDENNKLKVEIFLESVANRLNDCSEKNVLEHPFIRKSLLAELKQVIHHLYEQSDGPGSSGARVVVCSRCFYSRLFDVCYQLNAEDMAQKVLKGLLKLQNFDELLICRCIHQSYVTDPVIAFSRFVCFIKGWEMCSDIVNQLANQMLAHGKHDVVSEIALNFLHNDNLHGAREIFQILLETVKNNVSKPEEFKKFYNLSFVHLAIRLTEEDEPPNREELELLVKHLEPSQLTELIQHLASQLKDGLLDCKLFMKEIGHIILGNNFKYVPPQQLLGMSEDCRSTYEKLTVWTWKKSTFYNLAPHQLLQIISIYRSMGMPDLMKCFWKNLCFQCILISHFKEKTYCPLCEILRHTKSDEARQGIVADLSVVEEFKDAVKCSLQKLHHYASQFNAANCFEYIQCIARMEKSAHLPQCTIIEHVADLFSRLSPDIMERLLSPFFQCSVTSSGTTTMKELFVCLLKRIGRLDVMVCMDVSNILMYSAWFGALDMVKVFVNQLYAATAIGKRAPTNKFLAIFEAIRGIVGGNCAASSPNFSREIFNYLMLECLKLLKSETQRINYCSECFNLLATSERSFPNSTPASVTEAWQALIKSFSFPETVSIMEKIFEKEVNTEVASLRKLSSIWAVFKELSESALSKWQTAGAKSTGLTETSLTSLVQCFFWVGEEKCIADVCRLVNQVQRSDEKFADVHTAIVREKKVVDLATSSFHATLALNDLIYHRIQILNERLTNSHGSPESCSDKEPAKKCRKVALSGQSKDSNSGKGDRRATTIEKGNFHQKLDEFQAHLNV